MFWRGLSGGFFAFALLVAAVVELLVGVLLFHVSIMSQILGRRGCVRAVPDGTRFFAGAAPGTYVPG